MNSIPNEVYILSDVFDNRSKKHINFEGCIRLKWHSKKTVVSSLFDFIPLLITSNDSLFS